MILTVTDVPGFGSHVDNGILDSITTRLVSATNDGLTHSVR